MPERTRTRATGGRLAALWVAGLLAAGCSTGHSVSAASTAPPAASSASPSSPPSASSPVASPVAVSAAAPASSSAAPTPTPSPTPSPSPTPKPAATPTPSPTPKPNPKPAPTPTPTPRSLLVEQLASTGSAQQVVTVTSSSWGSTVGTLQTFEKVDGAWRAAFPAMPAHLGRSGFSANRHEGDGTTPAGMFGFGIMFGQQPNPGVKFPYKLVDSQSVWVGDSSSPYYNTLQENASLSGEHLASSGYRIVYAYAADIAFNTSPVVPGKGSAIFLHVTDGGSTAGCVALEQSQLLQVLRWLDPAKHPVIVMGPSSVITKY
jgi:L,D-peptidoglycan transpeptidase YkuD (ErfK/YbiS/YcfS/YnhG family)